MKSDADVPCDERGVRLQNPLLRQTRGSQPPHMSGSAGTNLRVRKRPHHGRELAVRRGRPAPPGVLNRS